MALADPYCYYIESRHAFKAYIQKSFNEIKNLFHEGEFQPVEDEYLVVVQDDSTKLSEDLARLDIEKPTPIDGIVSFELRYNQNDKKIRLLGYAYHNWQDPHTNTPSERKWGTIPIEILTQTKHDPLQEKQSLRKMNIYVNISYLKRKDQTNIYQKIQIVSGNTAWISMTDLEAEVEKRIKQKKTTIIALGDNEGLYNDPLLQRLFQTGASHGQRGVPSRNPTPINNHRFQNILSNSQDPWDIPEVRQEVGYQPRQAHHDPRSAHQAGNSSTPNCGRGWNHDPQMVVRQPLQRTDFVQPQNFTDNASYEHFDQDSGHQDAVPRQHQHHTGGHRDDYQQSHPVRHNTGPEEQSLIFPPPNVNPPQVPQKNFRPEAPQVPPRFQPRFQIGGQVSRNRGSLLAADGDHYYQRVDYSQHRNKPFQSINNQRYSAPYTNSYLHSHEQRAALDTVRKSIRPQGQNVPPNQNNQGEYLQPLLHPCLL